MKIKTSEATEQQLNWLVAKCEGEPTYVDYHGRPRRAPGQFSDEELYTPTTDWAQGGPIIAREMSAKCGRLLIKDDTWVTDKTAIFSAEYVGFNWEQNRKMYGPTPLVAGMRCYVASKLGEEVEIPDELIGE